MDVNKIVLHVERVVLNGFREVDQREFRRILHVELARHLGKSQAVSEFAARADTDRLEVDGAKVPSNLKPEQAGAWVAQEIARSLGL